MSNDLEMGSVTSTKKRRKEKNALEKKSSKKRKRLDDATRLESPELPVSQSRKKKRRLDTTTERRKPPSPVAAVSPSPRQASPESVESVELPSPKQSKLQQVPEIDRSKRQPNHDQAVSGPREISTPTSGSPFFIQTTSFYLSISPIAQTTPLEAICAEHLSPLILTYSEQLNGVVLSYRNPRFSKRPQEQRGPGGALLSKSIDEYGVTYVWAKADFVLLRPQRDSWIWGAITMQSESHIGLVCWNLFNASIERSQLPKGWRWVPGPGEDLQTKNRSDGGIAKHNGDTGGYWVDAQRNPVEGPLRFRVWDFESSTVALGRDRHFLSIEGTLRAERQNDDTADATAVAHVESEQANLGLWKKRGRRRSASGDERPSEPGRSTGNESSHVTIEDSQEASGSNSPHASEAAQLEEEDEE